MKTQKLTVSAWLKSGDAWVWLNAAAVAISIIAVVGLLLVLAVNGFKHFWPSDVMQAQYQLPGIEKPVRIIGEIVDREKVSGRQLISAGVNVPDKNKDYDRYLMKVGNRDVTGADFGWFLNSYFTEISYPEDIMVLERTEWGSFYGKLLSVKEAGNEVPGIQDGNEDTMWSAFEMRLGRALKIKEEIHVIEKGEIGAINYGMERLRLKTRRLALNKPDAQTMANKMAQIEADKKVLDAEYKVLQEQLTQLYVAADRDSILVEVMDGSVTEIKVANIVRALRPNKLSLFEKIVAYLSKLKEFLTDDPREANTEGGIYPAIFGTVMMVLLMSIMVTPFGVVAAVYLREYAKQGPVTRAIRIAVNNLAGVPSIVYGVFGLGFFIYFIGEHIDHALFPEALPSPTFGTPGLLWASLTLALLTLPVVIVATEEGLARIPRAVREGSLALGATKAETLWRVVLPMASPAMMTGLILAVARAAGEVAPLMLVGVVKLAPSLPFDGNYPFLHLDQKFMHLGFHIYDVGFQSPNVEAARPLVYATALLLVIVIALLNLSAVTIRNHLREKYKSLEH